ncbi:MAG: hypothetical protein JSV80_01755 [Acidobacteriota bacterium]|nr:MAG: hypothetical protein JSV80_01755 [Acidobacteriota bacterium]
MHPGRPTSWLIAAGLAAHASLALAAAGVGELSLDAAAVAAVVKSGMPGPVPVSVPGMGSVTLAFEAADTVRFIDGGLESRVSVAVQPLGLSGHVAVRYEPAIDRASGIVRLHATKVQGEGPLSLLPDLASLLPPVDLPRGFRWTFHPQGGTARQMTLDVHAVTVTDERLIVKFGLQSRAAAGATASVRE